MPQLPRRIGGKYRPIRQIGQGGMGAVYEVVHENTGEHLALKVMLARSLLAPDLVERFRREARAASAIRSEHVVRVTDADVAPEFDDAPFLVMELLQGQNFERLSTSGPASAEEVLEWMRPIARALDKAHRQGVIHRDLKPENLFLAEREDAPPIVKILDFGIAKMTQDSAQQTASDQILGTPRYMAPEQTASGTKLVSGATDRFALGLIVFRMLSGRHYFDESNVMKLLMDAARGPTSPPSALGCDHGAAFDAWFARACAVDPAARFPSCVEQMEGLAAALGLAVVAPLLGESSNRADTNPEPTGFAPSTLESAPTLGASAVAPDGRPGLRRRHAGWLLLVGALGTILAALTLNHGQSQTIAPIRSGAMAPGATALPALPLDLGKPPAAVAMPSTTVVSPQASASAALRQRLAKPTPASARSAAPRERVKPKDRVWDER